MASLSIFLDCVVAADAELAPWEIADALWLAERLEAAPGQRRPRGQPGVADGQAGHGRPATSGPPARDKIRVIQPPGGPEQGTPSGQDTLPLGLPVPRELPHPLSLQRGLRPLARTRRSGRVNVLDEEATVALSADAGPGMIIPRLAPAREKWLDLAIVVDTSSSMVLWGKLIAELRMLTAQLGAFRAVRTWYLRLDGNDALIRPERPFGPARPPKELVDPTGCQVIWLVTDCVADSWRSRPVLKSTVETWARSGPLAVVQPLPRRMWARSKLSSQSVRLQSPYPGAPNASLLVEHAGLLARSGCGIPVPVLEIDHRWFGSWSRLVAGTSPVHVAAAFVGQAAASPGSAAGDARYEGLDAEGLVREFMAVASPEAFRLAGLLSAAPLNLPLMRGIQQAMSAEPRQAHLAEVLLSGLLRDVTPTADSRRSGEASFTFTFKDGVRDALLATVRRSEAISVLEFVSEAYSRGVGTAAVTSRGRVHASGGTASATPASDLDVYGEIEKTVLRRIGGQYARVAANASPAVPAAKPPVPGPQQIEPYEDAHGIVMLGGPGSGKTTYLAALSIALFMRPGWRMVPKDDVSAEALTRRVQDLTSTRVFPMGGRGQVASYQWRINGEVERTKLDWRRRIVRYLDPVGIDFRVTDAGGEIFARPEATVNRDELLDVLARSRGIVFLFDPTREFEVGDTFDYVHQVVTLLAQRMLGGQGARGERLPHHVAVCVSKFDNDWVFGAAEAMGMVSYDPSEPYGFPQVADEDAREFLRRLCRASPKGTAELAVTALEQFFHPQRVRYFVTSAIGFNVNRLTREFDPHDRANYVADEPGSPVIRIRGAIHPIGVAEPVLWLGSRLTGIPM